MRFTINQKISKEIAGNMIVRLQNENKIIFNNKLKSDKNLYIKSQYTTQQKY